MNMKLKLSSMPAKILRIVAILGIAFANIGTPVQAAERTLPGDWDGNAVRKASVLHEEGGYKMWYDGLNIFDETSIGLATSDDGTSWMKYSDNPVLVGEPEAWDSSGEHAPFVMKDGDLYKMWYEGFDGSVRQLGYATSPDGITWTKYEGNPVLQAGPEGYDNVVAGHGSVLPDDGLYKLWYHAIGDQGVIIAHATSPDGIHWTKEGPALLQEAGVWDEYGLWGPSVLKIEDTYWMWYSAGSPVYPASIGAATSLDGTNWSRVGNAPVITIADNHIGDPHVIFEGGIFKMWFNNFNDGAIYYAESNDGINWNAPMPALNPGLVFPLEGWHDGSYGEVDPGGCVAFGWSADPDDRDRDVQIRVFSDGEQVAEGLAQDYGEDMEENNICPGGTCRFTINLWDSISHDEEHQITVQAYDLESADWWNLEGTPKSLTCLTPPPPNPHFTVFPEWEWFDGLDWPDGATVEIMVKDKLVCNTTSNPSSGGFFNGGFPEGCDIVAGDEVTFTFEGTIRTHTVRELSVTEVDADANSVTGTSDPDTVDTVYVWPHCCGQYEVQPLTSGGVWLAEFPEEFEMEPGMDGRAEIRDDAGNATAQDWSVPWPPSTFVVNTTDDNDDGTCDETHCSLREAINTANARAVPDTIIFNIPGDPPFTIQPQSPIPDITDPVMIDGTTQPGFGGSPVIELDGRNAGNWASGLLIAANDSTVKGLVINRFSDNGIILFGSGNTVQGNYIGTDTTGTSTIGSENGPAVDAYTVEVLDGTCPTYDPGTDRDGFVSESDDPLAPWSGTSVTFKGTDEDKCGIPDTYEDVPLIYRYRLEFEEPTELASIAITGAAFNGGILRVLDANMDVLGTASTFGGNSFQTNYIVLDNVEGTIFYIDEFDYSSDWRYRQSIVINGPLPLGNHGNGVLVAGGAMNNFVVENLISGNAANGVGIFNPDTTGNTVRENHIGTDITGMYALGNNAAGVGIGDQAYDNFIFGNLISGNKSDGIAIFNPGTNGNTLQGNNIGTDASGMTAVPNDGVGVWIGEGASNTLIGGTDASVRNIISGNQWGGVSINHLETTGTQVLGNFIGTNKNGDDILPNGGDGVFISASQSIIGGAEPGAGNLISGNTASGVDITGSASANVVQGNYIGTDVTGTSTAGPAGPTVGEYALTVLPETCPTYDAGTDFDGFISESDDPLEPWSGTSVHFVGTDECGSPGTSGEASLIYRYKLEFADETQLTSIMVAGAAFNGPDNVLRVADEDMNILGTATTFGGNSYQSPVVTLQGVVGKVFYLDEFDTSTTWRFRQNIVINGPLSLGNLGSGVAISGGASDNQILGNLISGNRSDAVALYNSGTNGNILQGNYIGTDASGTAALPNTSAAIWIGEGASNTLIGGVGGGEGNIISGNTGDAISINNAETTGTVIQGNFIGTDVTGNSAIPNLSNGIVLVTGTHDNLIGGTEPGAGNTIAFNNGAGILIADAGVGNAVLSNSVFSNGWLGIDLGGDYLTYNDPLDQDTGPNELQNFPIITVVRRISSEVMIQGLLPSTPLTIFRVELFSNETCDPSGFGEGELFLGATTVKTNPAGLAHFAITVPDSLPQGGFVTATATDPEGNTSEFSKCFSPAPGWNQINDNGFGDSTTIGVTALEVFQNQLYAGTANWDMGGQIWRLGGDGLWSQVSEAGFGGGTDNPAVIDMTVFQGQLYVGTGLNYGTTGQVWRTADGINWQPVTIDGFGDGNNTAVTNFITYKGMLYAGTGSVDGEAQIWRSLTGSSGSWIQVAPDDSGLAGNVTGFAVFKNALYAAIEPADGSGAPIQVWRSANGNDWVAVTEDGFGYGRNESTGGFAQFGGYLYLGTRNEDTGAQLWRTTNGMQWYPVVGDGFGDLNNIKIESLFVYDDLFYAVTYSWAGLQVWHSADGLNWDLVIADGFGDSANFSTLWNSATTAYHGKIVIGTWNNNEGGELWMFTP